MEFYDYWILKTNVNSNVKIKLIEEFGNSENIFKELIGNGNLCFTNLNEYDKFVKSYHYLKENFDIDDYNKILNKHDIKFVKITDDNYPDKLKNIDTPPFSIFYKGDINIVNYQCISIIGTRNPTPYGEEVCKNISKELSFNGVNIVSGGARGKHVIIVIKVNMICINKEFKGFQKNKLSMYYLERIINYRNLCKQYIGIKNQIKKQKVTRVYLPSYFLFLNKEGKESEYVFI